MGNVITNKKVTAEYIQLSNLATCKLMSVLALSACDTAASGWEKRFAQWVVEQDDTYRGLGLCSFDIADIGWNSEGFDQQKQFVLKAIDTAINEHRWGALYYNPTFAKPLLVQFRNMIAAFDGEHIESTRAWSLDDVGMTIELCPKHQVYLHLAGCILCNNEPS